MDNLDFLTRLNDECIDLVCIDPPFKKNQTFVGKKKGRKLDRDELERERDLLDRWGIGSRKMALARNVQWPEDQGALGAYKDIWSWEEDIHEEWLQSLRVKHAPLAAVIETTRLVNDESMAAYLCFMAIRLVEIHRVLKPTGSLFLHCDRDANSYLRLLLDGVFGHDNMKNHIAWCYPPGGSGPKRAFHNKHDTVLYYRKSDAGHFERPHRPMTDKERAKYTGTDPDGRKFKEYPGGKKYLDESKGPAIPDWWTDIHSLGQTQSDEKTGYPTQKPFTLAERIIKATTEKEQVVLDCFAGCAYTAVAAEKAGRRWVACDNNPRAWTMFKWQFSNPKLELDVRCDEGTSIDRMIDPKPLVTVWGPSEFEKGDAVGSPAVTPIPPSAFKEPRFKQRDSLIPHSVMLKELLEISDYMAWCCGFANRYEDGSINRTTANFHLDHINPVSKGATSNQIYNRAPLCPKHNVAKGNRSIALTDLRDKIILDNDLSVRDPSLLVDLTEARERADEIYRQAVQAKPRAD